ncbi:MAG TPA: inositol monophosphatase [Stellaceae bacterium]|nr:inositol monophosphatase [Stellaceae bacterium]
MLDPDRISAVIRDTAMREIVPRFRALASGDIREKKPGDLVTVADEAAERVLIRELAAAEPGSVALGEESVAANPALLDLIAGDAPVWVIDPVDGTGNFAKGAPDFAVIVAYIRHGVTEAGWIYDPLGDVMLSGSRGDGVWCGGRRIRIAADARPGQATGSAYGRTPGGIRAAQALTESGRVGSVRNRGCSGLEYIDVALGRTQFTLHSRSLPWDHAAGMMLVTEAGGRVRFLDDSPYDPRITDRRPLAAADERIWRLVQAVVTAPPTGG